MRWVWGAAGFVILAIGLAALAVPVVPTSPFLVAAAACFLRASPRLERWLVEHPQLGGPIRDWRAGHGLRLGVKLGMVFLTACGMGLSLWTLNEAPTWVRLAIILGGSLTAWFFLALPTRSRD